MDRRRAGRCTASSAQRDRAAVRRVDAVLARRRGGADDPRRRAPTSRSRPSTGSSRGVAGLELPGSAEDRALRVGLRDEHERVRDGRRGRRGAARAAARGRSGRGAEGLAIAAAATHPFARPEAQPIVKEERYVTFVGYGGISVRRQGVQGLHVHVGMPSAEECWRCLEAIVPWLPVVLALSANSPWFAGELTGMASNRAPMLAELPRAGGAARVRVVRRVGGVGRAARAARRHRGLHAHLVGRAAASEARDARGARSRPADRRAALGGVRSAAAGALRDGARRRAAAARRDARRPRPRRLRAEPLGGGALRAARASCCIPTATRYVPASELGAELLELVAPRRARARRRGAARAHRPERVRGRAAARSTSPAGGGGGLVARSLG